VRRLSIRRRRGKQLKSYSCAEKKLRENATCRRRESFRLLTPACALKAGCLFNDQLYEESVMTLNIYAVNTIEKKKYGWLYL